MNTSVMALPVETLEIIEEKLGFLNSITIRMENKWKNNISFAGQCPCGGNCSGSCTGTCHGGCTGSCAGTCTGSCQGGCSGILM